MDFVDELRDLSARIPKLQESRSIKSEEATKTALVMPFITALGYDVHNPHEVIPEHVADFGTNKRERVDYAIVRDGQPIMLFECKDFSSSLIENHLEQLWRYFSVIPSCRFGVLTNGVEYRFYTDLDKPNLMDKEPFFCFNLAEFDKAQVDVLKRFTKTDFNVDRIMDVARDSKRKRDIIIKKDLIKKYLTSLASHPSEAFVKLVLRESGAYEDRLPSRAVEQFTPIIRNALRALMSEEAEERLKIIRASETDSVNASRSANNPDARLIETTQEEIEAFMIVRAIVRSVIDTRRVVIRDNLSYCAVNIDDNQRRPLCRLHLNSATHKYLGVFDEQRKEIRMPLSSLDDIYKHAEILKATAARYARPNVRSTA